MLFTGTSLDKALSIFADYAWHRPAARLLWRSMSGRVVLLLVFQQFIEHPLNPIGARFLRPRFVDDL
jgi:hypothetical protein